MFYINGILIAGGIAWQTWPGRSPSDGDEVGVRLAFHVSGFSKIQRRECVSAVRDRVRQDSLDWLVPDTTHWIIDCEGLRMAFQVLRDQDWLQGSIRLEPEWEEDQRQVFDSTTYEGSLVFYVTPNDIEESKLMATHGGTPPEISQSLSRFAQDYPDPNRAAFIMMRFGKTGAHGHIVTAIKTLLAKHGINGLRADDRQYHDDLFPNILTYMHGCGFGIAVFERLESDDFNPNVSLELGYMLALPKPVCLLKDTTLRTLHSDLMGKLYRSFNPQDPSNTIALELEQWLKDKGIIKGSAAEASDSDFAEILSSIDPDGKLKRKGDEGIRELTKRLLFLVVGKALPFSYARYCRFVSRLKTEHYDISQELAFSSDTDYDRAIRKAERLNREGYRAEEVDSEMLFAAKRGLSIQV